jgi:ABC-type uncharacterized transport system permease subunit
MQTNSWPALKKLALYLLRRRWALYLLQIGLCLAISILIGSIVILISGDDPLAVYAGLIQQAFFTPLGLMIAIQRATSLILTSLAGFVPAFFKVVSGVSEVITGVIANQIMPSLLGIFLGLLFLRVASRGREI